MPILEQEKIHDPLGSQSKSLPSRLVSSKSGFFPPAGCPPKIPAGLAAGAGAPSPGRGAVDTTGALDTTGGAAWGCAGGGRSVAARLRRRFGRWLLLFGFESDRG
mmetsp:Transcript_95294/g.116682  ORF Transcript_95294/g.116682 Transcript_95294/m.116682 type:complete len:105 (-) Transcript_95294:118-432(-)